MGGGGGEGVWCENRRSPFAWAKISPSRRLRGLGRTASCLIIEPPFPMMRPHISFGIWIVLDGYMSLPLRDMNGVCFSEDRQNQRLMTCGPPSPASVLFLHAQASSAGYRRCRDTTSGSHSAPAAPHLSHVRSGHGCGGQDFSPAPPQREVAVAVGGGVGCHVGDFRGRRRDAAPA